MSTSRTPFVCASCARTLRQASTPKLLRPFSTTPAPRSDFASPNEPRWKQTPPQMRMPFKVRPDPKQPVWNVNTEQQPVDEVFDKFLGTAAGTRGRDALPEEIMWQSLTHKSFDHARRPFNDKLAFLGKRIVDLQTSLLLLSQPLASHQSSSNPHVYTHPSLTTLPNLTPYVKTSTTSKSRLAQLAGRYGLDKVVRWKPRKSDRLESSGVEVVLAQAVYAIVGAVALQRGGDAAAKVAKERVLGPLGLK